MDGTSINIKDSLEVTGVSRCGRVRKKSSKLVDFQSPDDIEAEKVHRRPHKSTSSKAQRSLAFDSKISERPTNSTIKSYFQPVPRFQKLQTIQNISKPTIIDHITSPIDPITTDRDLDLLSSLTQFDDDCSDATRINNNDIDSDDYELVADQTVRNSAYMSEKKPKKTTYNESRTQRKDKGKPRFTAYMLWSKEIRQEMFRSNTDMSFSQVSRRLSQMWANVPNNERHIWRRRAKRVTMKIKKSLKTGDNLTRNYLNKMGSKKPGRSPKSSISPPHSAKASKKLSKVGRSRKNRTNDIKRTQAAYKGHPNKRRINSGAMKHSNTAIKHIKLTLPGTSVIDTAAHLKLLGDSLTIIGQRLKEHEGQIAVSGSLSVLLDSLLCSLAPLMCLTTLIHGVDEPPGHLKDTLVNTLDNIAYVMPGI